MSKSVKDCATCKHKVREDNKGTGYHCWMFKDEPEQCFNHTEKKFVRQSEPGNALLGVAMLIALSKY